MESSKYAINRKIMSTDFHTHTIKLKILLTLNTSTYC